MRTATEEDNPEAGLPKKKVVLEEYCHSRRYFWRKTSTEEESLGEKLPLKKKVLV